MKLPATGTAQLLELLTAFVPDDHINELLPRHRGRGRRSEWSAAQLLRVLMLLLLSPVRSSNQLCRLLPEQRAWRRFAHLPNRRLLPNVRQLHEFRDRLCPTVLRAINEALVAQLLEGWPREQPGIGLIDSTDLPAATSSFKKSSPATTRHSAQRSERARSKRARAAGMSATKNTRCDYGWLRTSPPCS
jgi:hypothetical protein